MSLFSDQRQVATSLSEIRRDHVARYEWAARLVEPGASVLDYGCGIGYGSAVMSLKAGKVYGFDVDDETIAYARKTWGRENVEFARVGDRFIDGVGLATAFEVIEHIEDPAHMLRAIGEVAPVLLASVPNERVLPWRNTKFHFRHYTREQFEALLNRSGWKVAEWWGQHGPESEVERDVEGRTLVAKCVRAEPVVSPRAPALDMFAGSHAGKHVAIVGLGPSAESYLDHVKRLGSRAAFCDEVWGINAIGSVLDCDLVFHMDDVRIQALRAAAKPESNIANMVQWLKVSRIPVITSRAHADFPALVEYPFQSVVNNLGRVYFNNTAAYAIAYAIYCGVGKISLFGIDFTYPNAHKAEKGRANCEFWLGYAAAAGIEISAPVTSTIIDANVQDSSDDVYAYGYDAAVIKYTEGDAGEMFFDFSERETLPTAEEVEAAYDHGRPPAEQHMRKASA